MALLAWAGWLGWDQARFCQALGIDERTLIAWKHLVAKPVPLLGPKPSPVNPDDRRAICDFLTLFNGAVSRRELGRHFPCVPKSELSRLYWAWRFNHPKPERSLFWHIPGAVWAIDYTYADCPIDGIFPYLLVVRDLASGRTLAAIPTQRMVAENVLHLLEKLFVQHSPPIVIKSDNGSHFIDQSVTALFARFHVTHLLSPPYYPRYNGACEAGIGALKIRIHQQASRVGHPLRWTTQDVAAAVDCANARPNDYGFPDAIWAEKIKISDNERDFFMRILRSRLISFAQDDLKRPLEQRRDRATIFRHAIAAALSNCGYLTFRSRSIHQPLPVQESA